LLLLFALALAINTCIASHPVSVSGMVVAVAVMGPCRLTLQAVIDGKAVCGMKTITVFPANRHPLYAHQGSVMLFEAGNGASNVPINS
jgi:ornithine cyclodeaminase/alanine dehydrogenase-like protein (mu-crystallin family)